MAEPTPVLAALLDGLGQILAPQYLLREPEQLRPFECDGLSIYRQMPMVAVLPGSHEEVREILRLCHKLQVPVVTRGAGTGLSAGAMPHPEGVLLVMSRMNRIVRVDPLDQSAVVQPGVANLAISRAVASHGLFYAPDPSSQIACSIGGNVAENAGGVHCLKYGLTVHNILRLRVLTMSGDEVILGSGGLDGPGFNLLALLTGSEGMLGVVTEITVRLLPRPTCIKVMLAAFASVAEAGDAVGAIIAAGIVPAGLEMMYSHAIQAAEDFVQAGYPRDAAAILLVELDGGEVEVSDQVREVEQVLLAAGATLVKVARDEQEAALFWKGRKNAFPAVGRLSPDYYCMDGTIPRSRLTEVLSHIEALSTEYGLRVANVFHAGDGNLHPLILFDANQAGEIEQAEEMGARILEKCIAVGGTITGEHGVGLEKIRQMPLQFSDAEVAQFHRVKAALDPDLLLNPGKNLPSLRHCQEYRALARDIVPNALGQVGQGHE